MSERETMTRHADHQSTNHRPVIRVFMHRMASQKLWLLAGAFVALLATASGIALLMASGWFITASGLAGLGVIGGAIGFNFHYPSGMIRGFAMARTAGRYAERLLTHEATFRALTDLRLWLFGRLIPLTPGRLAGVRLGDLLTRLTNDIDQLDALYLRLLVPSGIALIVSVTLVIIIGSHDLTMALVGVGLLLLAGLGAPWLASRLAHSTGQALVDQRAALRSDIGDTLDGVAELLVYQADGARLAAIADQDRQLGRQQTRMAAISGLGTGLTSALAGLAMLGTLSLGLVALAAGRIDGPVLAMIVLGIMAGFEAVAPLPLAYQVLSQIRRAGQRILDLAEAEPTVREPAPDQQVTCTGRGDLVIDKLGFAYPANDRADATRPAALRDIDLTIAAGERVGIVGPSGAGKSTLFSLLLRMHEPDQGTISWGGASFDRFATDDLFRHIGVLTQSPRLFSASIRDNLLLGRPDADDAALMAVLERVDLAGFVTSLPGGLDTWLGDAGAMLSGGQSRRLALARVLLKDPPLLLLDEPTEGLDPETEQQVVHSLDQVFAGRSVLLVTHRLAPLAIMDRVIRLEAGQLQDSQPASAFIEAERNRIQTALTMARETADNQSHQPGQRLQGS